MLNTTNATVYLGDGNSWQPFGTADGFEWTPGTEPGRTYQALSTGEAITADLTFTVPPGRSGRDQQRRLWTLLMHGTNRAGLARRRRLATERRRVQRRKIRRRDPHPPRGQRHHIIEVGFGPGPSMQMMVLRGLATLGRVRAGDTVDLRSTVTGTRQLCRVTCVVWRVGEGTDLTLQPMRTR